jgi:hypothetical protein
VQWRSSTMPPINLRHRGRVSCCPVLAVAVLAHSMVTGCALGVASRILRRRGQLRSHHIADHLTHVPCVRIVLEDYDRIERSAESLWGEELKVGGRLPNSDSNGARVVFLCAWSTLTSQCRTIATSGTSGMSPWDYRLSR